MGCCESKDADDLGRRLLFIVPATLVGGMVAGRDGGMYGGAIGFAMMLVYGVYEFIRDARRKRKADRLAAIADAEANAAHDAEVMSP